MKSAIFWAALSAAPALALGGFAAGCGESASFKMEEVLANPTADSVQLSLLPSGAAELYVEYWEVPGGPERRSEVQRLEAGDERALVFRLEGLEADREYGYRVSWKADGEGYLERPEAPAWPNPQARRVIRLGAG